MASAPCSTTTTSAATIAPVTFNIGGRRFATQRSVINRRAPNSMLARLLSDDNASMAQRDAEGAYFFDRDGDMFVHVLEWLRNQRLGAGAHDIERLRDEFEFWGIECLALPKEQPEDAGALLRNARERRERNAINDEVRDYASAGPSMVATVSRLADILLDNWYETFRWQSEMLGASEALVCMHGKGIESSIKEWGRGASTSRHGKDVAATLATTRVYEAWARQMQASDDDAIETHVKRVIADSERYVLYRISDEALAAAQIAAVVAEVKRLAKDSAQLHAAYTFSVNDTLSKLPKFDTWRDGVIREHMVALRKDKQAHASYFPKPSRIFKDERLRDEWTRAMAKRGFAARWVRGAIDRSRGKWAGNQPRGKPPVVLVFEDMSEHVRMVNDSDDSNYNSGGASSAHALEIARVPHGTRGDLVDVYDTLNMAGGADKLVWLCRVSWAQPVRQAPLVVDAPRNEVSARFAVESRKRQRVDEDEAAAADEAVDAAAAEDNGTWTLHVAGL